MKFTNNKYAACSFQRVRSNNIFHLHFLASHDPIHLLLQLIWASLPFHSCSHKPYIFHALHFIYCIYNTSWFLGPFLLYCILHQRRVCAIVIAMCVFLRAYLHYTENICAVCIKMLKRFCNCELRKLKILQSIITRTATYTHTERSTSVDEHMYMYSFKHVCLHVFIIH